MIAKRSSLLALFVSVVLPFVLISAPHAEEYPGIMFILDGSGSMWGKAGDRTKIEAAREVMHEIVPGLPEELSTGLTSYGDRRKGDCADVETLFALGLNNRGELLKRSDAISPKGTTPIADSIPWHRVS